MYCNKCGKQIDKDSLFCQFCGNKIVVDEASDSKDKSSDKNTKPNPKEESPKNNSLWDKFAEVYDAKGDDRKKFDDYSSADIWDVINRLSINAFEEFLTKNREEINKQPYKTIETLKNAYLWSVLGGYRLWLAETLLENKKELGKFKPFSIDKFIEEWKKYDFDKAVKALSEEMGIAITRYANFRVENFMENAPEAKELPVSIIEQLKTSLLLQTLNGYHAGKIESKFRI